MTHVSSRLTSDLIAVSRERGLPIDEALAGFPVPLAVLEDPRGTVEWTHLAHAMEILERVAGGPPEGLADLARALDRPGRLGSMGRLFRFAVEPAQLYKLATRWAGPAKYPTHETDFERLGGGRCRIDIRLDPNERGCAAFFHGCRGFLEIAPRLIGLEEALVEAEIGPHRGVFLVTPPPSASILARPRRLLDLFRGSEVAVQELRAQHEALAAQRRELRAARAELEESERRFADALHASPVPMMVLPLEGEFVFDANESFLETSGITREQLATTPVASLPIWPPEMDLTALDSRMRRKERIRSVPVGLLGTGGELRRGLLSSSPSRFAGRDVALVQILDVTELHELEERLSQSQKMEVVGQLAGGVAHDFNNLLTVIGGYADQLLSSLEPGTDDREATEMILEASDRASKLTGQLLAFARRQILRPRRIDLNATVSGALEMLGRLIGESISLRGELESGLPPVVADPGKLEQVLLNLALNARDAMPTGGNLTVTTRRANPDELMEAEGADPGLATFVALDVADTGTGMSPSVRSRIFEPFFTTKEPGAGTGLGLSTIQGIVVQSGGRIRVESARGTGTLVTVYLPADPGRVDLVRPTAEVEPGLGGGETVLLVEDEERVREVLRRQLESAGYRVLLASCGVEALEVEAAHPGPIQAMVCDVVMPRMSGAELAEAIRPRRPELRILFISGYTLDQSLGDGAHVLSKPFRAAELIAALRSMLALANSDPG